MLWMFLKPSCFQKLYRVATSFFQEPGISLKGLMAEVSWGYAASLAAGMLPLWHALTLALSTSDRARKHTLHRAIGKLLSPLKFKIKEALLAWMFWNTLSLSLPCCRTLLFLSVWQSWVFSWSVRHPSRPASSPTKGSDNIWIWIFKFGVGWGGVVKNSMEICCLIYWYNDKSKHRYDFKRACTGILLEVLWHINTENWFQRLILVHSLTLCLVFKDNLRCKVRGSVEMWSSPPHCLPFLPSPIGSPLPSCHHL